MTSTDPVRIALIGAGNFGRHHLKTWRDVAGAEVAGVFDTSEKAARRAADEYHIERVYASLDEALSDAAVDAVDVCVPNRAHAAVVIPALGAGKHCLCEKPLAAASSDIERMIAARDRSGKLLMTAQHFRFDERSVAFKKQVDAGRIGDIYYARAWWLRRRMTPTTPGFITSEQSGGGACVDIGVHALDLAMHFMSFPRPVRVTGVTACRIAARAGVYNDWGAYDASRLDVEDFAAGFVRFENGAVLTLEASWMLNIDQRESYGVQLFGDAGGGRWPELRFSSERDGLLLDEQVVNVYEHNGYRNEMRAFVEALRGGGASPVPAEQSLIVARILEALYESSRSRREVTLD